MWPQEQTSGAVTRKQNLDIMRTHKKGLLHTWSQSAVEEAALEESEPANSKEKSSRGCTGLEAVDWITSEICSNFRTLGFQDFSTSGSFVF